MDVLETLLTSAQDTDRLNAFPLESLFEDLQRRIDELGFSDLRVVEIRLESRKVHQLRQKLLSPADANCLETRQVCFPIRHCIADDDGRPICWTHQDCEERCVRWEYDT